MVGPNIGWVPRTSTPSGAHLTIASIGPALRLVKSMRRLSGFIRGASSSATLSVSFMGTLRTTTSLSATSARRSSAKATPSLSATSTRLLGPQTVTEKPWSLK